VLSQLSPVTECVLECKLQKMTSDSVCLADIIFQLDSLFSCVTSNAIHSANVSCVILMFSHRSLRLLAQRLERWWPVPGARRFSASRELVFGSHSTNSPRSGGTRLRSPASQPRDSKGKSRAPAGEAAFCERSSGGRLSIASTPASVTHLTLAPLAQGARQSGDHGGEGATRTPRMDSGTWRLSWHCLLLVVLLGSTRSEGVESCEEVRKLFQWRIGGAVKGLPYTPRSGPDLQVCVSKDPTCCTRKMEERYQIAARQDLQQVLQTSSSTLKLLISRNAAAFQGCFDCVFVQYLHKMLAESRGASGLLLELWMFVRIDVDVCN
ncbi:hypothetical protein STEG23_033117, partial [Scotinomys teguina]